MFALEEYYMLCENYFCIYQKDRQCVLEKINLDIQGRCKECIYIDFDEFILQELKNKLLKRFESDYKF